MSIIPGGQIGEIVSEGRVKEKQYQPIDTDTLKYCWLHNLTLASDWKNPSVEDKKKLDEIELRKSQTVEKDGRIKKFRFCPKCWHVVEYTRQPK